MNGRASDSLTIQQKSRKEMNKAYQDIATNNESIAQLLENSTEAKINADAKLAIENINAKAQSEINIIKKNSNTESKKINPLPLPESKKTGKRKEINDKEKSEIQTINDQKDQQIKSIQEEAQQKTNDIPNQKEEINEKIKKIRIEQNTSSQLNTATGLCELHGDRETQQDAADADILNTKTSAWDARSKRSRARALRNTVSNLEKSLEEKKLDQDCGSTLNASIIGKKTITTANVGDSAAILTYWNCGDDEWQFKRMGHSHNIEDILEGNDRFCLNEQNRIKNDLVKYKEENYERMSTGINMTRSVGDNTVSNAFLEKAISTSGKTKEDLKKYRHSHEPEITETVIPDADFVFLITACDGLTDEFSDAQIAYLVYAFVTQSPNATTEQIAVHLAKWAYDGANEKKIDSDNITVLVTDVNQVIGKNKNDSEEDSSKIISTSTTHSSNRSNSSSAGTQYDAPPLLDEEVSENKKENETIPEQEKLHFVAVFDGHGNLTKGHLPAQQLRAEFKSILQENLNLEFSIHLELSTALDAQDAINAEIKNIRFSETLDEADRQLLAEVEKNTRALIQAFWPENQNIHSKNNTASTQLNPLKNNQETAENHGENEHDQPFLSNISESNATSDVINSNDGNHQRNNTNKTLSENNSQKESSFQNYLNTIKKVENRNRIWKRLGAVLLGLAGIALLGLAITVAVASVGGATPIAMFALPIAWGLLKAAAVSSVMVGGALGASTLGIFGSEVLSQKSPLQNKMGALSAHAKSSALPSLNKK